MPSTVACEAHQLLGFDVRQSVHARDALADEVDDAVLAQLGCKLGPAGDLLDGLQSLI